MQMSPNIDSDSRLVEARSMTVRLGRLTRLEPDDEDSKQAYATAKQKEDALLASLQQPLGSFSCGHVFHKGCIEGLQEHACPTPNCQSGEPTVRVVKMVRRATDDGLTCAFCREIFVYPCTTTCGHTVCQQCFLDYIKDKSASDELKCGVCRVIIPFSVPPVNTTIQGLCESKFKDRVEARKTNRECQSRDVLDYRISEVNGSGANAEAGNRAPPNTNADEMGEFFNAVGAGMANMVAGMGRGMQQEMIAEMERAEEQRAAKAADVQQQALRAHELRTAAQELPRRSRKSSRTAARAIAGGGSGGHSAVDETSIEDPPTWWEDDQFNDGATLRGNRFRVEDRVIISQPDSVWDSQEMNGTVGIVVAVTTMDSGPAELDLPKYVVMTSSSPSPMLLRTQELNGTMLASAASAQGEASEELHTKIVAPALEVARERQRANRTPSFKKGNMVRVAAPAWSQME